MSEFVVAVLAFLGGVAIGIFGMYLSDGRYLKNIQYIYEKREKQYEETIERQKETIDRLFLINDDLQIERVSKDV